MKDLAIQFMRIYQHIAPSDIDDILESLEDRGFLSEAGEDFKHEFWDMFIHLHTDDIKPSKLFDPEM